MKKDYLLEILAPLPDDFEITESFLKTVFSTGQVVIPGIKVYAAVDGMWLFGESAGYSEEGLFLVKSGKKTHKSTFVVPLEDFSDEHFFNQGILDRSHGNTIDVTLIKNKPKREARKVTVEKHKQMPK